MARKRITISLKRTRQRTKPFWSSYRTTEANEVEIIKEILLDALEKKTNART